ncbi:MAG: hypothetical protein AAGA85_27445 [Bacteroidota bacterium]
MRFLLVPISLIVTLSMAHAQGTDSLPATGNIEEAEVIIEKERELILPKAQRSMPPLTPVARNPTVPALAFNVEEPRISLPDYNPSFRSVALPPQERDKLYSTELRAGYGNYNSPLLGIVHHGSLDRLRYGANLFHESFGNGPIRDDLSGTSVTRINADVSGNYGQTNLGLSAGWKNYGYYFYGLSDEAVANDSSDFIVDRATYNHIHVQGEVGAQTKGREVLFTFSPRFDQVDNNATDAPKIASESNVSLPVNLTWNVDSTNQVGFDAVPQFSSYTSGGIELNRSLVSISPWYSTSISVVKFRLGLQLNFVNDSTDQSTSQIGAVMSFQLPLGGTWLLDGGIDNRIHQNRLMDLYPGNLYLEDSLSLRSSIERVPLWAIFQGYPLPNVHFMVQARIQDVEDALYYTPSANDSSRFDATYELDELGIFELKSKVTMILQKDFTASASFAFYDYQPGTEIEAWYRPSMTLELGFTKRWEKLVWQTNFKLIDGLKAPSPRDGSVIDLDLISDLATRVDYRVSDSLSAFVTFDNILNQSYEYYLNYPSRGLTVKGGIRYRF